MIVSILLTTVLVAEIFTANVQSTYADSRILKQDTKQNTNCDTVGANSTVSDSCNQRSANNVNNGITTAVKPTGTLLVIERCIGRGCPFLPINVIVTGNNPQPSSFTFISRSNSQLVTLGPGSFEITESTQLLLVTSSFDGDCAGSQTSTNQAQATGTISAGQHLTCTIANFAS